MGYRIKYHNFSRGFSIAELLVVLGIFAILFSISTSVYNNSKLHSNLEVTTNSIVEAIRLAQSSAQSGKNDSKWGVEISSNQITIFKGNNYTDRDVSFDEIFDFSSGVSASGLGEIVFEKLIGTTSTIGTVTLTNVNENKNIIINEKGTITY